MSRLTDVTIIQYFSGKSNPFFGEKKKATLQGVEIAALLAVE